MLTMAVSAIPGVVRYNRNSCSTHQLETGRPPTAGSDEFDEGGPTVPLSEHEQRLLDQME